MNKRRVQLIAEIILLAAVCGPILGCFTGPDYSQPSVPASQGSQPPTGSADAGPSPKYVFAHDDERAINSVIDKLVPVITDEFAEEYRQARTIHLKDNRAFVLMTIEGFNRGNNYYFYLVVLDRQFDKVNGLPEYTLRDYAMIGGIFKRAIDFEKVEINDNKITLNILTYGPDDSICCPSVKGRTTYMVTKKGLKEVKSN